MFIGQNQNSINIILLSKVHMRKQEIINAIQQPWIILDIQQK